MSRPSRAQSLIDTAYTWAKRSTCSRLQVGCVIEQDGRILVQGYNGAPAGLPHCDHTCKCQPWPRATGQHHASLCPVVTPCLISVHAEQNAVAFAARWGVELAGASAWVTHQPCLACAQTLIQAGICEVSFVEPYRLKDGLNLLLQAGVIVHDLGLTVGAPSDRVAE